MSESLKPRVGMVFDSVDQAYGFYVKYAHASGFSVRKNTSYNNTKGVLKLKHFTCSKEGFKIPNKGKGKRRKPSKRVGCEAHTKLQLTVDGKYDMVFVPFTGIDNHNRNITLGVALLGSETADSYRWLLRMYVKAFGVAPKVVVTDQDLAMKTVILDVLPDSCHRLCMWHIWEKLTPKLGPVLCNITDLKKKTLAKIVWSDSISRNEFEEKWHAILSEYGLSNHEWLGSLYNIRHDWIPAYYLEENLSGLMRTTSRSESENHFFNQFCNPHLTLVEFFSHFETTIEAQRYEHRKNDHETRYSEAELWFPNFVLEEQASKLFIRTIFLDQQLEIDDAINNSLLENLGSPRGSVSVYKYPMVLVYDCETLE
ncbi:protein FAR1-RELATED SEQUENCE 5-like [Helianthus annuus]|uniref:protein FAR1-RELATED SEQUENCE 5-like n=1 Tax=Helianthus annuus TaxID=4232 RepID=UPI000B8F52C0|nr:protein FAR1-RELATED SEQUENCE 5-like [Helianthus annuus]